MLFTYNPKLRFDRNRTPKRDGEVRRLHELLEYYGIDESQVVYVGRDENETRHYVAESAELVETYFDTYEIDECAIIFSDNGRSFFS